MSKTKRKKDSPEALAFEAKVREAFAPYLKFRAGLRTEMNDLARINLLAAG